MHDPSLVGPGGAGQSRWPRAIAWLLVVATVVHAAMFLARVANPLVISDTWYFVDAFLRKYAQGDLALADFFAKRSAVDHALPVHKLLLLLDYRLFGLDLTVDAWIGFAFGVATIAWLRTAIRDSVPADVFAGWPVQLAWATLAAVYLSLNVTVAFEWPLLTLSFMALFCCFALYGATWHALAGGRAWPMLLALLAVMLVSDGGGVIAVLAAALAAVFYGVRERRAGPSLRLAATLLAVMAAYKIALQVLVPPANPAPGGSGWATLLAQPGGLLHVAWGLTAPLSASVLHPDQARVLFGEAWPRVDAVLRVFFLCAHAVFWWMAWTRRTSKAWCVAVATMLLFYGLVAGVLIGRVPQFGERAFLQPRYVVFYQLQVVALLLMATCWLGERAHARASRVAMGATLAACVALLVLQVPLDRQGWRRAPFQERYVHKLAEQMEGLASTPETPPPQCLPQITVCRMDVPTRVRAVVFLRDRQLNVFSPAFRRRHGFAPAE